MKGRTKFFNYFIACIATLSLATFAACSDDDPETPSGKLVLTASASSFVAGEGNVTFMVTYDGEDVTSQAAITNVTTGEPVENAAWTTTEIGEYKFQAVYDSYTSDPVTPAVTAPEERTFNFEATIEEGWNAENCAFVVYVFKEEANGKYIVNNGAECAVDGSVDYRYEL